jgi:hypothetical protein
VAGDIGVIRERLSDTNADIPDVIKAHIADIAGRGIRRWLNDPYDHTSAPAIFTCAPWQSR